MQDKLLVSWVWLLGLGACAADAEPDDGARSERSVEVATDALRESRHGCAEKPCSEHERGPVCLLVTQASHHRVRSYWASNGDSVASAARALGDAPRHGRVEMLQGACDTHIEACAGERPLCAFVGTRDLTHENLCAVRNHVLTAAGSLGSAHGIVLHEGACRDAPCASADDCGEGERCTVDDGVCNTPPGCTAEAPCPKVCYGNCTPPR